ncbi:AMP-binding protein [Gordonia sp. PDNC005]|uniref:AMP-binding protein n=1 Tax=unclassified Gordonia (in: high G+C Gram-positive bacteria) TaxID=2657482 RepID=UPI001964FB29|nr:AMP-binding protein [Gordonia sp. PDNC005]QRY61832.1 AMP-binding protein [Gordonia sp. PDNC005]
MTGPAVTDPRTIGELLEPLAEVVDRGVWFEGEFTSWRDHLLDARRRAAAVRSMLDASRPAHVGILLPNSVEFSSLFAAAALGGFVLVGLNSTRRGAALTADAVRSDCQLVLVDSASSGLFDPAPGMRVINVDSSEWSDLLAATSGADFVPAHTSPDDLVMLIFTSGTTGDPKAVRCSQRKFAAAGAMLADRFGIGPSDVAYLAMPMFHSNALIAGWSVAAAGGASIAIRRSFSARGFGDDVRRYGVTYANYVGKPLHYILATEERPDDRDVPLRIMYGNEASASDRAEFNRRFGARVIDGFGSTEGGVSISRTPETPDDALGPLLAPNAIVDPDTGEAVAPGVVGEIVNTSGPGLFDGYYGDQAATDERLRGGMYRTGDLGWVDDEGFVHFAGRIGDWLRVDGENLGTRPIETVLRRHPAIREVVVVGVPTEIGDAVGAVLVAPGLDRPALDEFLDAQPDLGPKQRPTRVWLVEALPETATFKTARAALAASLGDPSWIA